MSNKHHSEVIEMLAAIYKPQIYIELGLYKGETWYKAIPHCGQAFGVDIVDRNINGEIFVGTTDDFFEQYQKKADMIFIDADHRIESVLKDFENSLNILRPGGCIILHDTDPESNHLFGSGWCGDSYKIVDILEERSDLNCITIPCTEAGLSIVTRKKDTRTYRRNSVPQ